MDGRTRCDHVLGRTKVSGWSRGSVGSQIMGTPLTIGDQEQTSANADDHISSASDNAAAWQSPSRSARQGVVPIAWSTYVSANEAVAVVNAQGMIEVVGIGTSTITAYQNGSYDFKPAPPASKLLIIKPMIVATCEPVSAGKVGGAGLYAPGQKATLTARPATGYTFAHWEDASLQTSPRVLIYRQTTT